MAAPATTAPVGRRLLFGATAALALLLATFVLFVLSSIQALTGGQGDRGGSGPSDVAVADIPAAILPLYLQAGQSRGIDWAILAAIGKVETDHGRSTAMGVHSGVNFAGCCAGPMQFSIRPVPGTWGTYAVDGDNDGIKDVYNPADAIPAAADLLKASGAPGDYQAAIFAYNHAAWYVAEVLAQAQKYRTAEDAGVSDLPATGPGFSQELSGPWLMPVPGTTTVCDSRIVPDVRALLQRYRLAAGDCFSLTGHASDGEHPLGLAIDLTPTPRGSWDLVEQAARDLGWRPACGATGCAGFLPGPFRFIGYNGYPGHGDPAHAGANAHLHLSWQHTNATPGTPATRVKTLLPAGTGE